MKPTTYIAGPMRGLPEFNYPAFRRAAERLRALGHIVVSPVELNHGTDDDGTKPPVHYLRNDILALLTCDAIAVLPGWQHSTGARLEVAVAITFGFRFFDAGSGVSIATPSFVAITGGYERNPDEARAESLDVLAEETRAFARATFKSANPHSIAEHLRREAVELAAEPEDEEEMADVFLLLSHLSAGRDLAGAVRRKLEKNKSRKWGEPDAGGVQQHVDEAVAS